MCSGIVVEIGGTIQGRIPPSMLLTVSERKYLALCTLDCNNNCTFLYFSIKRRYTTQISTLQASLTMQDGVLAAAWPHKTCDAIGFSYDPSFRLQPPHSDTSIASDGPQELQHVVQLVNPCARCWDCCCQSCQHLCYKIIRLEKELSDAQGQTETTLRLIGLQEQTSTAHWNLTSKEVCTKFAKALKDIKSMELSLDTLRSQLSSKDDIIKTLNTQISMYKERDDLLMKLGKDNEEL